MKPSEGCVWNAVDREWLLTVEDEAMLVFGAVAAPPSGDSQRAPEHYDGAYGGYGADRSHASVQPYTRECMVDFDCGGCACGVVMAPCNHCMEHWAEDQS